MAVVPLSAKLAGAFVLAAVAYVAGLGAAEMFAAILAVDLAQFGMTLEHRGRIASVEREVSDA